MGGDAIKKIKTAIWAYFLLLLFEGALRKWILPELSVPLLIIRDPVACYIIWMVISKNLLRWNPYIFIICVVGLFSFFTSLFLGHGNLAVTVYGARILLLHFPLIFIIGSILDRKDVLKIGEILLLIAIPMTVLNILQFYSPQSSWVNRGVGGDLEGAGFNGGALGYFRPPGTFSFTTGNTLFFGLVACYILYFWLHPKIVNKLLLGIATLCLFVVIPISISRSLFFQVGITLIFAVVAIIKNPKLSAGALVTSGMILISLGLVSQISVVKRSTEVFVARFVNSSKDEGGLKGTLVNRFFGDLKSSIQPPPDLPFWGFGLGIGTNVGSQLLTGKRAFLVAEGEWGRLVGEMGLLMGLIVIMLRLSLAAKLALKSYQRLADQDILPWMLLSFGILLIAQGGLAQPTALGFTTLVSGLLIASLKSRI